MPRAMWKGAISFGLVTIPVSLYPATEEKSLKFHQLHDEDAGRVRYKKVCEKCGQEVSFEHIVKGYEYEKDHYVVLDEEDFEAVPVDSSRAIDIVQFVELDEIDPMMYKKSYYLVPERTGAKAYALLRQAMSKDSKVGVAKVSFRDKEHLAALRFREDAFVLETMFWPQEIRQAEFGDVDVDQSVRENELTMARQLIETLTGKWDPDAFQDEYREGLMRIVDAKIAGEEVQISQEAAPARIADLMEALKASVAAANADSQEDGKAPKKGPSRRRSGASGGPKSAPRKKAVGE